MRVTVVDSLRAMLAAHESARYSPCKRLKVGCALLSASGQIVYTARNGVNHECTGVEGACGCEHAEARAVRLGLDRQWCDPVERVFVTHQPCEACAKLLIELGTVRMVRWLNPYRLTTGADLLVSAGIDAKEWKL